MHVSDERGYCRSALKSPVMIIFLYVGKKGDFKEENFKELYKRYYVRASVNDSYELLSFVILHSGVLSK